ncbi:unnamed protein product [Haemonchus placei]|uniref:Pept_C1 domain-containing protein n=1 Tax=Haemonchus placei TaxID=6290 RepID=A0A0N4VUX7_HAEPC|nr:unnamed protein product [Haemonchus placei]
MGNGNYKKFDSAASSPSHLHFRNLTEPLNTTYIAWKPVPLLRNDELRAFKTNFETVNRQFRYDDIIFWLWQGHIDEVSRNSLTLPKISIYFDLTTLPEDFAAQPIPKYAQKLTGKALEEYVNKKQSFFKAKYSEVAENRLNNLMKMEFLHAPPGEYLKMMPEELDTNQALPESFDARDKWKNCSSVIGYIRDQSNCGSCWAVSAAETMSDRLCIGTNGRVQVSRKFISVGRGLFELFFRY